MQQKKLTHAPTRAFTLIELLVVVLIIGILAAVAVPQYQVAVDKSRYTTMMNATLAVKQEQELYYLANGNYSSDLRELQQVLPAQCSNIQITSARCGSFRINMETTRVYASLSAAPHNTFILWYDSSYAKGLRECLANKNDGERARRLCKSLGAQRSSTENGACDGNCTTYNL